jgi:flagellar export protein FliJ
VGFRFSLEPVLRLRVSYERMEHLRLLAIGAMIVRLRNQVAAAVKEENEARGARGKLLARGATSIELQFDTARATMRAGIKSGLDQKLAALEKQQTRQALAYQTARRKRELLQTLREQKLRDYRSEQERRQQQLVDELHLLRRRTSE